MVTWKKVFFQNTLLITLFASLIFFIFCCTLGVMAVLVKYTDGKLRDHLIDELDYALVPEPGWDKLLSWYGMVPTHEAIPRKVVEHGAFVRHCKVEVYLMEVRLCENSGLDRLVTKQFSKGDSLGKWDWKVNGNLVQSVIGYYPMNPVTMKTVTEYQQSIIWSVLRNLIMRCWRRSTNQSVLYRQSRWDCQIVAGNMR